MNRLAIFEKYLLNKYPSIYQSNYKIECESGWFALIDIFSEKLVSHSKEAYVTVAKEKYGQLSLEVKGLE